MTKNCSIDCEAGRKFGCQTYCCRLLVRLDPDERDAASTGEMPKGYVEKSADGYCIHLNRTTHLCGIWAKRSRVCRGYTCNNDFLLQVAVRNKFKNIAELVKLASTAYIPKEAYIQIPQLYGLEFKLLCFFKVLLRKIKFW